MLGSLRLMYSSAFGSFFLIHEISRKTPRVFIALGITPAFFFVVGRLRFVVVGNEIEHKASAFLVREDSPVAAHTLGNENSGDTRRPHHSGGMKLHKLHVDQFRASLIPK